MERTRIEEFQKAVQSRNVKKIIFVEQTNIYHLYKSYEDFIDSKESCITVYVLVYYSIVDTNSLIVVNCQ